MIDWTQIIIAFITLLVSIPATFFFTLKSTRKKAQAEAMKEVQEVYQETIIDLREDKRILKEEKDDSRKSYKELEVKIEKLEREFAILKRERKTFQSKTCSVPDCKLRQIIET